MSRNSVRTKQIKKIYTKLLATSIAHISTSFMATETERNQFSGYENGKPKIPYRITRAKSFGFALKM